MQTTSRQPSHHHGFLASRLMSSLISDSQTPGPLPLPKRCSLLTLPAAYSEAVSVGFALVPRTGSPALGQGALMSGLECWRVGGWKEVQGRTSSLLRDAAHPSLFIPAHTEDTIVGKRGPFKSRLKNDSGKSDSECEDV